MSYRENNFCVNSVDRGSIWGKVVDMAEINRLGRNKEVCLEYMGNYMTWDNVVYMFFHTECINYFVKLYE